MPNPNLDPTVNALTSADKEIDKAHEFLFDTSKLTDGIYFLKVICGDEPVKMLRLTIAR
jgi:hypothetical protein